MKIYLVVIHDLRSSYIDYQLFIHEDKARICMSIDPDHRTFIARETIDN